MRGIARIVDAMNSHTSLIACVDAYCKARKTARTTLSGLIMKDSRALDRYAAGGALALKSYERCLQWLSNNWPDDLVWPLDIERPQPTADAQQSVDAAA